ncbi:hypothetical protein LA329_01175 [Corynebacterium falsenii]|uniref:DUF6986 family protein n=1 Tax=Corynebacterium falsenii TaxID=108486 RepID=UPI001CCB0A3D|nr:hypothetical protein [Corynebacterium falsenii]UBI06972.1 hypothetical protein LA329_01175 [Corynebacterium falsenii]
MISPLSRRAADLAAARLTATDPKVAGEWSSPLSWRQPIHTVYIPASTFFLDATPHPPHTLPQRWGQQIVDVLQERAGESASAADAARDLAESLGVEDPQRVATLAVDKLLREPIEDVRIDFEDGFTQRGVPSERRDEQESDFAARAADLLADWLLDGEKGAPPFCGIRFKSFDPLVRERGIDTLITVLTGLHERGVLQALYRPDSPRFDPRALRLTFPKVQDTSQVEALVEILQMLEAEWGLDAQGVQIRFEIQVETPQAVIGDDGLVEAARMIKAAQGRCLSLHYGTYDYSAFLGVDPAQQSMEHPVADTAKGLLQVVARGHGVELSDGSTNRIPVGSSAPMEQAWALHYRLVTRHLTRGIRQGWDLHPHQLITRHLATIAYFRRDWELSARRLKAYVAGDTSEWMDEPATAKMLASFLRRAHACGAITDAEVRTAGVTAGQLVQLEATGRLTGHPTDHLTNQE